MRRGISLKNKNNELLEFLAGIVMLVVGLFILSQKVIVSSGWYGIGGAMSLGGIRFNSGLIIVPFIAGIVWMFASGASFASKVFTVLSVLLIIVSVILTTNIYLMPITLYEWVIILVLIFGGAGFVSKVLFAGNGRNSDSNYSRRSKRDSGSRGIRGSRGASGDAERNTGSYNVDEELEQLKKNMK